jgi:hypothetical protein
MFKQWREKYRILNNIFPLPLEIKNDPNERGSRWILGLSALLIPSFFKKPFPYP